MASQYLLNVLRLLFFGSLFQLLEETIFLSKFERNPTCAQYVEALL